MFRSLHMKLVLIMVLLIVSLMTVVGAFLINSVVGFYLNDFYSQMAEMFGSDNVAFYLDLTQTVENEEDGVEVLNQVLLSNMGALGVDGRNRNYYVLDGKTGAYLAGSDESGNTILDKTPNLLTALNSGEVGSASNVAADYMDVAVPITRGGTPYIIYILDGRQNIAALNSEIFVLIAQSLIFGLVISVLLSFLLAKTMITPIERLTDGSKRVADGDFSRKLEVGSKDEIGVLTETFNNMARQLQETLQDVENERNKLGALFLHMRDGVVAFAQNGVVIHCNPAAEQMLGRSIAVDGTANYVTLFGDRAPIEDVFAVPEDPGFLTDEQEVLGRHLQLLLAPYDRESQGGVLVMLRDVTEQRRTEQLRREFVANVSHELRTPLTNIRSYAETLSDSQGDLPPEMEQNFLSVILNESDRMTHIVQDLLTLSRLDSGHDAMRLAPFSFSQAIVDCYRAVLLESRRHGHTVHMEVPEDMPPVIGDKERIVQVVMNILSNAIKYTPDGGVIVLRGGGDGEREWLEVADNGIGIPPQDRALIFERFYRVDKARSRESGGTGLGLSIAKEIVDRHEGKLYLVDSENPGLTIRLELKIAGPSHGE